MDPAYAEAEFQRSAIVNQRRQMEGAALNACRGRHDSDTQA